MKNSENQKLSTNQNDTYNQSNKEIRGRNIEVKHVDKIESLSPDPYIIDNLMLRGGLTMLYGPSNSGKTSIAMDLGMSTATGIPWAGLKTQKSRVFYVASDANLSCKNKLIVCRPGCTDDFDDGSVSFHFITDTVNLVNKGYSFESLTNTIDELSCGEIPGLIIFDSLSACMAGADVNEAANISCVLATLHELQSTYGLGILLVQNTGKDGRRRENGHSLLRAAIDTSIALSTTFGENPRKLVVTKQRDIEKIDPLCFDLKVGVFDDKRYGEFINCGVVHIPDR